MLKIIAYCGLVCSNCPSFLATQDDDDAAREKTAALYAEKFGFNLKPEDINCDGCLSDSGRKLEYCRNCKIRECCRKKGLVHCAICQDRPCDLLTEFHAFSPAAKACFETLLQETHLR